jgi:hypothetical protein
MSRPLATREVKQGVVLRLQDDRFIGVALTGHTPTTLNLAVLFSPENLEELERLERMFGATRVAAERTIITRLATESRSSP